MTSVRRHRFTFILSALSVACAARAEAACQPLTPLPGSDGYQERGDGPRCEGMYSANVAGPPIELVSLTQGPVTYDLSRPVTLQVRPVTPASSPTTVQAVGIMPGLYYRMDAEIETGKTLDWPVADVLAKRGIAAEVIGVLGMRYAPGRPPVFVPLQVAARDHQIDSRVPLIAVLKPPIDAPQEIRWRFTPAGQAMPNAWQSLPVQIYKVEIRLAIDGNPLSGKLQVSWNDPLRGTAHSADFNIGP